MTDFYDPQYDLMEQAARRTRASRGLGAAYGLSQAGLQSSRALRDINAQYAQGLEPRAAGYAQRGLGSSGLFQRAMREYASAQQRDIGDVMAGTQQAQARADLENVQAELELANALDNIRAQKTAQIIADASKLAGFAPFTGLFA